MMKSKFLALVMLASAAAVSSISAFAQTHKRTHHYDEHDNGAGRTAAQVDPVPRFQPTRCLQAGRRGAIADAESTRAVSMHDAKGAEPMSILKLFASTILASLVATPVLAQAVIDEPGYCAQFYPTANCNNESPGTPTPIRTGVATEEAAGAGAQSKRRTRPLALYGSDHPGIGRNHEG
jgi:hypothetical protein